MSSNKKKSVQLGFAEKQEGYLLKNRFFPSKVGGSPAWLELKNIPEAKDLLCDYCEEPCIFLCQIYAGSEHFPHAFHRTIFVFVCRNGKCCALNKSGNIKILRSQLKLDNDFYPDMPADELIECDGIEPFIKICRVCGLRGPLVCGKCKSAIYCGQLHQKIDWKLHKSSCDISNVQTKSPTSDILFSEFEIVIEQEEQQLEATKESEKEAEKRRLREYEEMVKAGEAGTNFGASDADFREIEETKEDKMFGKFKKAIEGYETQILRYDRGSSSPLWISDHGILDQSNVPNCENCNARRTYEFQIMPQLLNELKNYNLDWGVITVYTCEKDCDVKGKYVAEFAYKQDLVKGDDEESEIDIEKLQLSSATVNNETVNANELKEFNDSSQSTKKSNRNVKSMSSKPKKQAFEDCDNWE